MSLLAHFIRERHHWKENIKKAQQLQENHNATFSLFGKKTRLQFAFIFCHIMNRIFQIYLFTIMSCSRILANCNLPDKSTKFQYPATIINTVTYVKHDYTNYNQTTNIMQFKIKQIEIHFSVTNHADFSVYIWKACNARSRRPNLVRDYQFIGDVTFHSALFLADLPKGMQLGSTRRQWSILLTCNLDITRHSSSTIVLMIKILQTTWHKLVDS